MLSSEELAVVQSTGSGLASDPEEPAEVEAGLEVGSQEPVELKVES